MLSQAVDEGAGQGGGHLQELIRVEERSHCGVQPGEQPAEQDRKSPRLAPGPSSKVPREPETYRTAPVDFLWTTRPNGCFEISTK